MNLEVWDQKIKALRVRSNFTTWTQKADEIDSVQVERLCITLQQETMLQLAYPFKSNWCSKYEDLKPDGACSYRFTGTQV